MEKPSSLNEAPTVRPDPSRTEPMAYVAASDGDTQRWRRFILATTGLVLCFGLPLWQLARFAATSELYSYILLIPFISIYLAWHRRPTEANSVVTIVRTETWLFLVAGLSLLAIQWFGVTSRWGLPPRDRLTVYSLAFLMFFYALCCRFWERKTVQTVRFPLAFLLFMVPIPSVLLPAIDAFLQQGSALAAAAFFRLTGTPFLQDNLVFQLPNMTLRIAPECSGIHSTLVLLITGVLAGHVLLRTTWKRWLLALFIIPLGLLRNGFRVFVIGELCVHVGPQMIDSPIHHRGGPIFFALSLIPLFLLLLFLRKSERGRKTITDQK